MELLKEFSSNQTLLLLVPSTEYNDVVVDVAKQLSDASVGYVTLNKTFDSLKDLFKKRGVNIENILFIDAITKTIKKAESSTKGCYFVSSPSALTELSLAIDKFLRHEFKYLVFDSITNLLIYQSKVPVSKFLSNLVNKIRETETKAVFYALSIKEQEALIKESSMFVDKVIDLEKK